MTPGRWAQMEDLYHRALELEKSRRTVFLQDACAGDRGLQAEVERLLAEDGEAGSFLEVHKTPHATRARSTLDFLR